jgi:hypothetical protein
VALALLADPPLRLAGVAAASCFAAAGIALALGARRELAVVRRAADRLILAEPGSVEVSELARWRAGELVAPRTRREVRRELERLLRQLDPAHLPSASPLRRGAVRTQEGLLRAVADRVGDERPVPPHGMVLVRRLLRDPASPLYADVPAAELARTLAQVLGALE